MHEDTSRLRSTSRAPAGEAHVYSSEGVRLSLAAAMALGLKPGEFHRGARPGCLNMLLTYPEGCAGNCKYCGLSRERTVDARGRSFIRVSWPAFPLSTVLDALAGGNHGFRRVCISMVTHWRAVADTVEIARLVAGRCDIPISALISPSVMTRADLESFRSAGVERIGIAFDLPTPGLFDEVRGRGVRGPHRWDHYWDMFHDAVSVFGRGFVGAHLIVGLGETEREMVEMFWRVRQAGGSTHLFSFYPETGSALEGRPPAPAPTYRRMQLARYVIDAGLVQIDSITFDEHDRVTGFGLPPESLERIVRGGAPFLTSGCPDREGNLACNRPYGDSRPGDDIRSYPFTPSGEDIKKIRKELWTY